jgi:WD40 repeat protein
MQACVFYPDSRHAITTSLKDQRLSLCVRDLGPRVPRVLQSMRLAGEYCDALSMAPDGKSVAVGEQNLLHVWPIKDGKIHILPPPYGHLSDVNALSFGACGNLLATIDRNQSLRLWDLDGSQPHQRLVHKSARASWDSVALSPDGTKLATGFRDSGFTLWKISPAGLRVLAEYKRGGTILTFAPDSKSLFSASGHGTVNVIDVANPTEILASLAAGRPGGRFRIEALAVSPDGRSVAFGDYDVELWHQTDSGWRKRTDFRASGQVKSLSFGGHGETLLVGGGSHRKPQVELLDVSGEIPRCLATFAGLRDVALSVSASSGGHLFAACDETGRVVVWSASGKILHEWTFPGPVHCVSFAPDGYHLALGNGDGTVYILRLADAAKK